MLGAIKTSYNNHILIISIGFPLTNTRDICALSVCPVLHITQAFCLLWSSKFPRHDTSPKSFSLSSLIFFCLQISELQVVLKSGFWMHPILQIKYLLMIIRVFDNEIIWLLKLLPQLNGINHAFTYLFGQSSWIAAFYYLFHLNISIFISIVNIKMLIVCMQYKLLGNY